MQRVLANARVSPKTLYHLRKMANASGTDFGRIVDRAMIFYRENHGDMAPEKRPQPGREKLRLKLSPQTLYHIKQIAEATGYGVGSVIDCLISFYQMHGGDALADEHTRQRSLLGRKTG